MEYQHCQDFANRMANEARSPGTRSTRRQSSRRTGTRAGITAAAACVTFLLLAYAAGARGQQVRQESPHVRSGSATQVAPSHDAPKGEPSLLTRIFGMDSSPSDPQESWGAMILRIALRLALAAALASGLAFRPRTKILAVHRNPYVAQTQILLAVVGSALMMIVADNAARAFGIFAAASLIRFRTNIKDPKETTVLLINLGIGLATGVGRWELAIIFTVFVLVLLYALEYYEPAQVFRAMELKVKTRNVESTDEALKEIFEKHQFDAELRELNKEDEEEPLGKISYYVNLNPIVRTDELSEEMFAADSENIDSIEWDQKRSMSYIYR